MSNDRRACAGGSISSWRRKWKRQKCVCLVRLDLSYYQFSLCRKPIIRRFRYFGGEHKYTTMTTLDKIRWFWGVIASCSLLTGLHKFVKILRTTSKLWAPEGWHKSSFLLSTFQYLSPPQNFSRPGDHTLGFCVSLLWYSWVDNKCLKNVAHISNMWKWQ